ncbi:MAG: alanine racemase [Oligosphaeraceae bacterium]|nr:alanine racemase [Oligosphaeraceae bacterium]
MQAQSELLIESDKICQNWRFFARLQPKSHILPVLKSDAYGHGLLQTAKALNRAGVEPLVLFNVEEAQSLRQAGIDCQLWLLEGLLPEDMEQAAALDLTLACIGFEQLQAMAQYGQARQYRWRIHLKVDTGMARLGFKPEELSTALEMIERTPALCLRGCFSHLAASDLPECELTRQQVKKFRQVLELLPSACDELHLCASNGILNGIMPELPYARLGIGLYGYCGVPQYADALQAAMSLKSMVLSMKEVPEDNPVSYGGTYRTTAKTRLAVVPVGYADGYPRALGNLGDVLIRGQRCPIRGRVCMGMLIADVSHLPELQCGEEVILLGRQGNERISAAELASKINSIPHEILCNLGKHPRRRFVQEAATSKSECD